MQTINFKLEFAPPVESGEKRQTIRRERKRPIVPGDTLNLYTGQRTKNCRLLRVVECRAIKDVDIRRDAVVLADRANQNTVGIFPAASKDAATFAKADGFDSFESLVKWFNTTYGLPFRGVVILW